MMGLKENKPLLICLMITSSIVLALASGLFPELCEYLEIVEFPEDVSIISTRYIWEGPLGGGTFDVYRGL